MILGNERRVKLAASSLVLVALVQGLVAIGGIGSTSRFVGTFDDPNYLGVFQSMAFCIILSRLTGRTRFWEKLILYALLALVGLSVLITFSRGAYLALFGGFAVIIWARLKNAKTQIVFVIGTAALGIWHSLSLLESLPIVQRFVGRLNIIEAIQTGGTGRTDIWKRAVLSLGNNPWGYGWGTETVVLSGKVSHNVFLEVAIQYGVIGFLLTIFLLGLIIGDAVHLVKKTENEYYIGFAASVICVLVGGVSLNMWYVRQFWYVLAMCVALADNLRLREYGTST
jgi:O-antigen ligase